MRNKFTDKEYSYQEYVKLPEKDKLGYWTVELIESVGFKLISKDNLWCRFKGHGFEVSINLDCVQTNGNHFNFHSLPRSWKGHFQVVLIHINELLFLLMVTNKERKNN